MQTLIKTMFSQVDWDSSFFNRQSIRNYFQHPGGAWIIQENLGYDATTAFKSTGHSQDAFEMLNDYLIGILPKHDRLYDNDRLRW